MPMTRHPRTIQQLDPLLPPGGRTGETRLYEDLGIDAQGVLYLADAIEANWRLGIDSRKLVGWKTLDDVAAAIDDAVEVQAA